MTANGGAAHQGQESGDSPDRGDFDALTDAQLLALHVEGDERAFGEIVRRHRDRLWAVALRTLGDPEEAADAVQDGLVSAYRAAAGYRGEAAVTTWLHRIVVNASLDRARRRASRSTLHLPEDGEIERDRASELPDDLERRELSLEVNRALAALPFEQAAAVVLIDIEGFSVDEAAVILECPPGTVKSRCSRGRVKLAHSLAHLRNRIQDTGVIDTPVVRPAHSQAQSQLPDQPHEQPHDDEAPASDEGGGSP